MKISETLATEMAELISPYSDKGILMPKTAEEIFKTGENWFPKFDQSGNLLGFFEYRTHDKTALAEMGSALVITPGEGVGKCLLQTFNTQKEISAATGGFAVTKDLKTAYHFFTHLTGGDLSDEEGFPDWFERVKSDKYFIQWR